MSRPLAAPLATDLEDPRAYKGQPFISPRFAAATGSEVVEVELAALSSTEAMDDHTDSGTLLGRDSARRPNANGSVREVTLPLTSSRPWDVQGSRESMSIDCNLESSPSGGIRVAGCDVQTFDDGLYSKLRAKHAIPDDFLESSLDMDTHQMATESKGGSPLYITADDRYVVKELSKADHRMLESLTRPFVERLLEGATVLCPIYLHFRLRSVQERTRIERLRTSGLLTSTNSGDPLKAPSMAARNARHDRFYIAMRNLTPAGRPWSARYDLKGCNDDKTLEKDGARICAVHKRFWRFWMWCRCCWTNERWRYYEAKRSARSLRIELPPSHCEEIKRMIAGDASWLADHGLMDYSLLLGVRAIQDGENLSSSLPLSSQAGREEPWQNGRRRGSVTEYICHDELGSTVICLGIIDWLQPWNCQKRVAALIKALESNRATVPPVQYGERFAKHFAQFFVPAERLERQPDLGLSTGTASSSLAPADAI